MPIFSTTGPSSTERPSRSPTDPGRGLIFYGDPHGNRGPLLTACDVSPPDGVILLGDYDLTLPLREQIASVFAAGIPVFWIPGNHDADDSDAYDRLWGDYPEGNLHARAVEVGGIRLAGLGGVFKGRIWHPDMAVPVHCSRADYLRQLPHTHRWRRGCLCVRETRYFLKILKPSVHFVQTCWWRTRHPRVTDMVLSPSIRLPKPAVLGLLFMGITTTAMWAKWDVVCICAGWPGPKCFGCTRTIYHDTDARCRCSLEKG